MKRTKEEALITRDALLSAALRVFSQKGYAAARLEDIAQAAVVTRGAIYHHFGSKDELFQTLVVERSSGINQLAEEITREGHSARETLTRLLVRLLQYPEENEDYRALLELAASKVEYTAGLQGFARQNVEGRRQLVRFLADLVQRGIQEGDFRSDLSPEDAAITLVGFLNGVGLIWVQDQKHFSMHERAEALVEVMMKGL